MQTTTKTDAGAFDGFDVNFKPVTRLVSDLVTLRHWSLCNIWVIMGHAAFAMTSFSSVWPIQFIFKLYACHFLRPIGFVWFGVAPLR